MLINYQSFFLYIFGFYRSFRLFLVGKPRARELRRGRRPTGEIELGRGKTAAGYLDTVPSHHALGIILDRGCFGMPRHSSFWV